MENSMSLRNSIVSEKRRISYLRNPIRNRNQFIRFEVSKFMEPFNIIPFFDKFHEHTSSLIRESQITSCLAPNHSS